jgi:hypothetical protein
MQIPTIADEAGGLARPISHSLATARMRTRVIHPLIDTC